MVEKGGVEWVGEVGWVGLNPILVSALAPFALVKVGAEIGAELDNTAYSDSKRTNLDTRQYIEKMLRKYHKEMRQDLIFFF